LRNFIALHARKGKPILGQTGSALLVSQRKMRILRTTTGAS
jgi:hypothetical protein